jgi:hypothetical protein
LDETTAARSVWDRFELVIHGSRRLVLLVAKKSGELEQVVSLDLMQVKLAAGFSEIVEGSRIGGKGLWFLREFGLFQEPCDGRSDGSLSICPSPFSGNTDPPPSTALSSACLRWRRAAGS